jgi:hypothetical protein
MSEQAGETMQMMLRMLRLMMKKKTPRLVRWMKIIEWRTMLIRWAVRLKDPLANDWNPQVECHRSKLARMTKTKMKMKMMPTMVVRNAPTWS